MDLKDRINEIYMDIAALVPPVVLNDLLRGILPASWEPLKQLAEKGYSINWILTGRK